MEVRTLTDGGQTADDVAGWLAAFLGAARAALDVAVYDVALTGAAGDALASAIRSAAAGGVRVRFVYNVEVDGRVPVPPPARTHPSEIESLGVPTRAIPGVPDLMHQKYVVRDGTSVWTGSANWTTDSWTREENVIVTLDSADVAAAFTRDFEDLWGSGQVLGSGAFDAEPAEVDGARIRVWFSPGRGRKLAHRIATAIGRAERRVRIASPVLTAGAILGTITDVVDRGVVDLAGVLDATQMREVLAQWRGNPNAAWKPPALQRVLEGAPFSGKASTPYGPGTVHDYMHAKVTVADDIVFVGSYNLSSSGQDNAENVLEVADPGLADRMAAFVDGVRGRYPALTLPPEAANRSGPAVGGRT
jgi:phosphatidylserine/phosphatidylglycerophosphate/cardiolipin synthase-like enzyme